MAFDQIINTLFPNICVICKRDIAPGNLCKICGECYSKILLLNTNACKKCSRPLDSGGAYCYDCRKDDYYFDKIVSAVLYETPVKELIYKYKYFRQEYLKYFIAEMMQKALYANKPNFDIDVIVPVPMHWLKELYRGYNQSALLAEELSKRLCVPYSNILSKKRFTFSQTKLSKKQRVHNISESFSIISAPLSTWKNVLLVDDVATTSATLDECSRILRYNGIKKIYCLTFARD